MSKQHPGLIKRTGVDGRHIWHIDKHVRGYGRLCESTETDDETLAGQILAKRLVDIRNAKLFGIRPPRTFREAADKYLKSFPEEAKENRAVTALKDVSEFIDHKFIHTINDDTFAPYITARRKEGRRLNGQKKSKKRKRLSIGTLNRNLGVVSAILNLCAELWRDEHTNLTWLETAPKIKLLDDPDRRPPYPISWDEQDLLFGELTPLLKDMCEFKVNSGLRDQAVCGLRWSWEQRVPELDSHGIKRTVFVIPARRNRKAKQPHVVVLNDIAQAIVEKYRGQDANYVFTHVNHQGERKRIGAIGNTGWRAARRRASARYPAVLGTPAPVGFRRLRVHDLKHTFGGRLRAAGVSKEDRKDLLGHRHKDITTDYSAAQLRQLLDCANRVVRRPGNTPMLTVLRVTMESDLPAEDWRTPANLPHENQVNLGI